MLDTGPRPGHPVAFEPVLDDGRALDFDLVMVRYSMPWLRMLSGVLAKDHAGIAAMVRELCQNDEGAEALGALIDQLPKVADKLEDIATACRDGHARIACVMCELTEEGRGEAE
jgi:hypothetical protein